MQDQFQNQLQKLVSQPVKKRFLIAASGGLDSTVLIHLCHDLELKFGICHVNFQLRAQDSDDDQTFLEDLAETFSCPIYVLKKGAKEFAKTHQISTQEAARIIRYEWFEECMEKHDFEILMTAHHADDNLETYLINSFRGTGIKGLTGIPEKRGHIIRPLLNFTREDILAYAQEHLLKWQEDQSNASDNYLRNVIRHHLLPFFKNNQDDLHARFQTTQKNINRQYDLLEDYLNIAFKQIVKQTENTYRLDIKALQEFSHPKNLLIELLKDFGFTDWDSVFDLTNAQVGKFVYSPSHKLVKERGFLELFVLDNKPHETLSIKLDKLPKTISFSDGELKFENADGFEKTKPHIAFVSKDLLNSDILLRPYEIGDYFCPLGMQGKRKLSDFLKDEKITTFEKSKIWVLAHKNEIIWVINHRIDDRFKITQNTSECLKITFTN